MCNKSGTSEHLGAAKIILAMASRNSVGHSLLCGEERLQVWLKKCFAINCIRKWATVWKLNSVVKMNILYTESDLAWCI